MRKPAFSICKNKGADQLLSNCAADQRLCFRHIDSTIPLVPKSETSSLWPSSVVVQPGLCWTWMETPKTGFLMTQFNYFKRGPYLHSFLSANSLTPEVSISLRILHSSAVRLQTSISGLKNTQTPVPSLQSTDNFQQKKYGAYLMIFDDN